MPVAIRAATRIQDMDDANVSLGVGVDEYALTWDNDTAKFVVRQVLLATGATTGATSQAQNFTVGVTVGSVTTPATLLQVAEASTASPRGIMSSQHNTGTDGARFHMRKSRGTNAAPMVVVTGDMLGRLVASGYDGSNYLEMGGIDIVSAGTIASTRVPTEIRFLTATDAAPSVLTQRMVIDKAGNVGIGTSAPVVTLHVQGVFAALSAGAAHPDTSSIANVFYNFNSYIGLVLKKTSTNTTSDYFQIQNSTGDVKFNVSGLGNVGIGTTSPATALHVVGAATITAGIRPAADSTTALQLQNASGTSVLNVDTTNARVGIGTTTLDSLLTLSVLANGSQRGLKIVSGSASQYVNILDIFASGPTTNPLFSVLPSGGISVFRYESTENDVRESIVLGRFYNGPGGVGMGNSIVFKSPDDSGVGTGTSRSQARIYSVWNVSATATRKADLVLTAYDTAEREGLRIRGNDSNAAIGFLGAAPIARIAHVADPSGGATVDTEARSAINSILATLEGFGFHATS